MKVSRLGTEPELPHPPPVYTEIWGRPRPPALSSAPTWSSLEEQPRAVESGDASRLEAGSQSVCPNPEANPET